jgi:hypothetical protein
MIDGRGNEAWGAAVEAALGLDDAARAARTARIAAAAQRRLTALESPWALDLVLARLDAASAAAITLGAKPPRRPPLIATTLDGAVNGWAVDAGAARHTLILVPIGLCMFCNLAAKAIAQVVPRTETGPGRFSFEMDHKRLRAALEADPMPAQRFAGLVRAYLLEGRADRARRWLPTASHSPLQGTLLRAMETFLVAHELGHVQAGHLDRGAGAPPADHHAFEHQADVLGLATTAGALAEEGTDPVQALVGAHLFLRATGIVARALALLRGEDPADAGGDTPTHPAAARRAALLADAAEQGVLGAERGADARDLCGRFDVILDAFAATVEAQMVALRQAGFAPHPVWRPAGRAPGQGAWPALAL